MLILDKLIDYTVAKINTRSFYVLLFSLLNKIENISLQKAMFFDKTEIVAIKIIKNIYFHKCII